MTDVVLAWLPDYGAPVLFVAIVIGAIGVPIPASLLLLAVGSLVAQEELGLWPVVLAGVAGATLGDQAGYALGRFGGQRVVDRLPGGLASPSRMAQAERFMGRWGAASVFLSRWLVGPLGPWVNLSSGLGGYRWPRFLLWDVLGELVWVLLYVNLGRFFSDRVQDLADLSSSLSWVFAGAAVSIVLGIQLFRTARNRSRQSDSID